MPKGSISLKENLRGKKVVTTGTGPAKRKDLEKILQAGGALIRTKVSGQTDLLVYDFVDQKRNKFKDAKKHKTPTKSYTDVFSLPQ